MNLRNGVQIGLILVFVFGCFWTLFYVYFWMPEQILTQLNYAIHEEVVQEIQQTTQPILFFLLGEVILGVLIIFSNQNINETKTNIIYVDKYQKTNIEETISKEEKYQHITENQQQIQQQIQRSNKPYDTLISELCRLTEAMAGAIFIRKTKHQQDFLHFQSGYAYKTPEHGDLCYEIGEGITGQVAKTGKPVQLENIPTGYLQVFSGLGEATPSHLLVLPIFDIENTQNKVSAIIELASFRAFKTEEVKKIEKLAQEVNKIQTPNTV